MGRDGPVEHRVLGPAALVSRGGTWPSHAGRREHTPCPGGLPPPLERRFDGDLSVPGGFRPDVPSSTPRYTARGLVAPPPPPPAPWRPAADQGLRTAEVSARRLTRREDQSAVDVETRPQPNLHTVEESSSSRNKLRCCPSQRRPSPAPCRQTEPERRPAPGTACGDGRFGRAPPPGPRPASRPRRRIRHLRVDPDAPGERLQDVFPGAHRETFPGLGGNLERLEAGEQLRGHAPLHGLRRLGRLDARRLERRQDPSKRTTRRARASEVWASEMAASSIVARRSRADICAARCRAVSSV